MMFSGKKILFLALFCLTPFICCQSSPIPQKEGITMAHPVVTIKTNLGEIDVELYPEKAPLTVANFLQYVDEKFYNKTIFHRVINGFMIQGGGFTADFTQKPTHDPIRNEADNGLKNEKGTIAMARTSDVHSATGQFFINVGDNGFLDFRNATPSGYGYCVFGKVIKGMDVVDKIKAVKTGSTKGFQDVPVTTVEILEITRK